MFKRFSLFIVMILSCSVSAQTLLVVGDSLSAGYQMSIEQAWPSLLPDELEKQAQDVAVINASVSGDTSGNGLAKLPALLTEYEPTSVLIALGANDGLRGFPPQVLKNNLQQMVEMIEATGAKAIMMQIRVPPNYGKRYQTLFEDVYPQLAEEAEVALIPFFLEQVILNQDLMMADGLHPKPAAQPWIAEFIATKLTPYFPL
ncbi:arylesterase [Vibrio sp. WXL210]|uniref:arylesterase n=1 Tax=Vibrio sp. WXL210 TaxID=3450709 RepID=UPI003EC6C223